MMSLPFAPDRQRQCRQDDQDLGCQDAGSEVSNQQRTFRRRKQRQLQSHGPLPPLGQLRQLLDVIKIALLDSYVRRSPVLLAYLRFSESVNLSHGSEVENSRRRRAPTPANSRTVCCSAR